MSGYVWQLPGADECDSLSSGHAVFWIHCNQSMRHPGEVIPVTAVVDDEGLVHITGDDLSLVRWNHRPDVLREALQRFDGMADWKPRWGLLVVPTAAFFGNAQSVFYLAAPEQRTACHFTPPPVDPPPWRQPPAVMARYVDRVQAEQERRNAEMRAMDHSHIPPLRVADRYAAGPRKRRNAPDDAVAQHDRRKTPQQNSGGVS